jgi:EAL domain-containing protein (putative c-di-GMP-specific phosphodiesterase class I)
VTSFCCYRLGEGKRIAADGILLECHDLLIDESFVRDIHADPDDAAITAAVINLARCLKMQVIAEGVETKQQLEFLRALDCDEIQGFLFSKPLPFDEFLVFVKSHMALL